MNLTAHQESALGYIKTETKRHRALIKAYWRYVEAARKLGFHPLDRNELDNRSTQLVGMEAEYRTAEWAKHAEELASWCKAAP